MHKTSVVVTVLNEAKTIEGLLDALRRQTSPVHEVIIVDGGSRDATLQLLQKYQTQHPSFPLQFFQQQGNRSVGRNAGIRAARFPLIAITDAGCIPHRNWLAELLAAVDAKQPQSSNWVVAGYYDAQPKTPFETAQVPYVLVMPDRVNPDSFLPATRSMLLPKKVWEILGCFDEKLSDNEDYAFAHKILDQKIPIYFAQNAKVTWQPRTTFEQFLWMIFRFARGDIASGIVRPKVVFLFGRYVAGIVGLIVLDRLFGAAFAIATGVLGFSLYIIWAIKKNVQYAPQAWYWLPILQFGADGAVIVGSLAGLGQRFRRQISK